MSSESQEKSSSLPSSKAYLDDIKNLTNTSHKDASLVLSSENDKWVASWRDLVVSAEKLVDKWNMLEVNKLGWELANFTKQEQAGNSVGDRHRIVFDISKKDYLHFAVEEVNHKLASRLAYEAKRKNPIVQPEMVSYSQIYSRYDEYWEESESQGDSHTVSENLLTINFRQDSLEVYLNKYHNLFGFDIDDNITAEVLAKELDKKISEFLSPIKEAQQHTTASGVDAFFETEAEKAFIEKYHNFDSFQHVALRKLHTYQLESFAESNFGRLASELVSFEKGVNTILYCLTLEKVPQETLSKKNPPKVKTIMASIDSKGVFRKLGNNELEKGKVHTQSIKNIKIEFVTELTKDLFDNPLLLPIYKEDRREGSSWVILPFKEKVLKS